VGVEDGVDLQFELFGIGGDHDTAAFAVESIRQYRLQYSQPDYSNAKKTLLLADGGGSNASKCRLWKVSLQHFTNETGLSVHVCYYPPGTSKLLAENPRLQLVRFPAASPDLNPQEHFWKATRKAVSHHHIDEPRFAELAKRFEKHLKSTAFKSTISDRYGYTTICPRFI